MNYDEQIDYCDRHGGGQLSQMNMLESDLHPRIDAADNDSSPNPYTSQNHVVM